MIDFDGATDYTNFSSRSGSTYRLTATVHGTDITVRSGVTVRTQSFSINATGTLTIESGGAIISDGDDSWSAGHLLENLIGGAGKSGSSAGDGGVGSTGSAMFGGSGGNGGGVTGQTGGLGGTAALPTGGTTAYRMFPLNTLGLVLEGGVVSGFRGGASGGGGAALLGSKNGGRGGNGAGVVIINARSVVNNGLISAIGGDGSNGGSGGTGNETGGGGGGGGGFVGINTLSYDDSGGGTIDVSGGNGGNGGNGGSAGADGSDGASLVITP